MLFGQSPFYNSNQSEMFKQITEVQYIMPEEFSDEAKDIIDKLLEFQPKHRLGQGKAGTDDVKNHPFFEEIDWDDLESNQ
jgi:serine/threonine protein kinase